MLSYILSHTVTGIVSGTCLFESHRMQLVNYLTIFFDLFENDPEFKSFHLDGQTIVLDDYLKFALKIATKSKVTSTKANSKLVPLHLAG